MSRMTSTDIARVIAGEYFDSMERGMGWKMASDLWRHAAQQQCEKHNRPWARVQQMLVSRVNETWDAISAYARLSNAISRAVPACMSERDIHELAFRIMKREY